MSSSQPALVAPDGLDTGNVGVLEGKYPGLDCESGHFNRSGCERGLTYIVCGGVNPPQKTKVRSSRISPLLSSRKGPHHLTRSPHVTSWKAPHLPPQIPLRLA